jgi:hypothetical protein
MDVQVPTVPARLQAWQVAVQAPLQQTPSAQAPDRHVLPAVQAAPLADFAMQVRELGGPPEEQ